MCIGSFFGCRIEVESVGKSTGLSSCETSPDLLEDPDSPHNEAPAHGAHPGVYERQTDRMTDFEPRSMVGLLPIHSHLIQAGDLQAVVGDGVRNGVGGTQYCGLWSLTSRHRVFNAFGNSFAGLLPGELRGRRTFLEELDATSAVLTREPDRQRQSRTRALYRVEAPFTIHHELTLCDEADLRAPGCSFREVSWCNYMNSPDDPRLHFLADGQWLRYIPPSHGIHSNVAPASVPDDELEKWPNTGEGRPFHWHRAPFRFDEPFYYGRIGDMVLLLVFDQPQWLRFFSSPSGGGGAIQSERTCPAWDFEWVIPEGEYMPGRDFTFRVRMIYKRFHSDDDILLEVQKAQQILHG